MTSDSGDSEQPSDKPAEIRGRPQKPPLTIDLTANPPAASVVDESPAAVASAEAERAGPGASEAEPTTSQPQSTPTTDGAASPSPSAEAGTPAAGAAAEPATVEPPASASSPRVRRRTSVPVLVGYFLSGLIGAAIIVAIVALIVASGIVPVPGKLTGEAAAAKAAAVAASVTALETRLAAVESRATAVASGADELAKRVGALEAAGKATDDRLGKAETALAARPEARSANMDQVLDDLMARIERVEVAVAKGGSLAPAAGQSDLTARIATLESSTAALGQRLAALQARPPAAGESEKAARALAIGSLRQAAGQAAPFAGNLAMLKALGLDETDIAALRPLAEKGAPPKSELAAAFPEVADRILAASAAADPNAGFFDRLAGFARGLVTVRPTAPIQGDTPDAIVSRMQAAVDHGDLARALAERKALPDHAKAASDAWAQGAADRLAIDRLVEKLSRAAGAAD